MDSGRPLFCVPERFSFLLKSGGETGIMGETLKGGRGMTELERLPIPLLTWYHENARVLPWRSHPTPYRVWIS